MKVEGTKISLQHSSEGIHANEGFREVRKRRRVERGGKDSILYWKMEGSFEGKGKDRRGREV